MSLDRDGFQQWIREFSDSSSGRFVDIVAKESNIVYVANSTGATIYELSYSGDTISKHNYPAEEFSWIYDISTRDDGGYIAVTQRDSTIWIHYLDRYLEIEDSMSAYLGVESIWREHNEILSISDNSGGVYIAFSRWSYPNGAILLVKYSPIGEIVWYKFYTIENKIYPIDISIKDEIITVVAQEPQSRKILHYNLDGEEIE